MVLASAESHIPREFGAFAGRDDFIRYLEAFAAGHRISIQPSTRVESVQPDEGGWLVVTSDGNMRAPSVVIATGPDRCAAVPAWPGRELYAGGLIHSSNYRNSLPYRDRAVLVVCGGDSGADIAVKLVEGGAARVWLSIRGAPTIVPPRIAGIPVQALGALAVAVPAALFDAFSGPVLRLLIGDLTSYGVPPRSEIARRLAQNRSVIFDRGFVRAVKSGQIEVVPAIEALDKDTVNLVGGSWLRPDAVIAATRCTTRLDALIGNLSVLDARGLPLTNGARATLPGLYFIGFRTRLTGHVSTAARDARRIARSVARRRRTQTRAPIWEPG